MHYLAPPVTSLSCVGCWLPSLLSSPLQSHHQSDVTMLHPDQASHHCSRLHSPEWLTDSAFISSYSSSLPGSPQYTIYWQASYLLIKELDVGNIVTCCGVRTSAQRLWESDIIIFIVISIYPIFRIQACQELHRINSAHKTSAWIKIAKSVRKWDVGPGVENNLILSRV